jgi:hypothetical protein
MDEYRAVHPDGYAYNRFCQLFREFERRLSPAMRQQHVAGHKLFVDYSGKRVPIANPLTGEVRMASARRRTWRTGPVIAGFVVGCGLGAAYEAAYGLWSLVLPTGFSTPYRLRRSRAGARVQRVPCRCRRSYWSAPHCDPLVTDKQTGDRPAPCVSRTSRDMDVAYISGLSAADHMAVCP